MMNGHASMEELNIDRSVATDPGYNIWVTANAGAGKTHILSERVIRLLVAKVAPSKILCLTYTNAAASEMKLRVFRRLAKWAILSDEDLKAELLELDSKLNIEASLKYARQLFAKVQDTPGGLKIQTIHAFCQLLLHNFCLEAGTERHFTLIDDNKRDELQKQALSQLLEDKFCEPEIEALLSIININAFNKLFKEIARNSNKFEEYVAFADENYLKNLLSNFELIEINKIIYQLASRYLSYFNNIKKLYSYVTYDDLIYRTKNLLYKANFSSWVHYKLDQGIDHVLVDEAQDTNPMQWDIIQALVTEFFAGDGQKEQDRSIFAVGDEKQAIYGFQGSQAADFSKNGHAIKYKAYAAEKNYKEIALKYSFRSAPIILSAVDKIFGKEENYKGLTAKSVPTQHKAVRQEKDSYIEFWDEILDETNITASRKLSKAVAQRVEELVNFENAQPKDILILVEKRKGSFCNELLFELKNRHIAVAGLDKLNLYNHIAIRDLCALGRFALHQYDDLALANIFKSPLLGLTEEDLYNIASNRTSSLWHALQEAGKENSKLANIVELLKKYCRLAIKFSPFEFYSEVLSKDSGRKKFLARLGQESSDVLNEFLSLCLNPKDHKNFTLHSFLAQIEKGNIEIKRELLNGNEVRIMTVHGSKGLEAPIVFIVCRSWKTPGKTPGFIDIEGKAPIFLPKTKYTTPELKTIIDEQKINEQDEKKRLLYVAITRAKNKLFISSYNKKSSNNSYDWHNMIKTALELDKTPKHIWGEQNIIRYYYGNEPQEKPKINYTPSKAKYFLPSCLLNQIEPALILPKPLSPSGKISFIEDNIVRNFLELKEGQVTSRHIGIVKHKLLQYLPDIETYKRQEFAKNMLETFKPQLTKNQKDEIITSVFSFLQNEKFNVLFGADSRAELAIAGDVEINGKTHKVVGQIDRLIQLEDRIIFCDYKTGISPESIKNVPKEHLIQMSLYYKLIYKYNKNKKQISPLLVYTRDLKSFELDTTFMEDILKQYI